LYRGELPQFLGLYSIVILKKIYIYIYIYKYYFLYHSPVNDDLFTPRLLAR